MTDKQITANLTITRTSNSEKGQEISIRIRDDKSGIQFFQGRIGLAEMMEVLTGLSEVEMTANVRITDNIGKSKITEKRSVVYAGNSKYTRSVFEQFLTDNCQEEGWMVNTYLGSQSSVSYRDGKTILNYSVFRYE